MLVRPEDTFIDQATKRAERIFPRGVEWLNFESRFPAKEVFANSVLDPAIGIGGALGVKTFATADWQNWMSAAQIGVYEIATRIGVPQLEGTSVGHGLSLVYSSLGSTLDAVRQFDDPAELIPELLTNAGVQVIQQLAGNSKMIGQTIAQVLAAAVWAVEVVRSHVEEQLGKHIPLPPMQTEDPATDTWQVNRVFEVFRSRGTGGVVFPDGKIEPASNADYTSLYLPAYRATQPWKYQHRADGIAAQQGYPSTARGPNDDTTQYHFDASDASTFGFMPGTMTTLRVLQATYRHYHTVRGVPVDRFALRCLGVDKPCWQTTKTFNGKRDCRQCVDPESVWPVEGLGSFYGGVGLNSTTPGENVGAFYPSTNKLLANLLDMITRPGPLLYTIDVELIHDHWKRSFERFWEFARAEWRRYNGTGWRGLISRLATLMSAFEYGGEIIMGGREMHMPLEAIANPRQDAHFEVPFSFSIFSKLIEPFCRDVYNMQGHYLDAVSVAYVPPGAGALYNPTGTLKTTHLAREFVKARRELLASTKRMLVDLNLVSDPEYRAELEQAGVKRSPVNPRLSGSPGVSGHEVLKPDIKPRRAPPRPRVSRVSPLEGVVQFAEIVPERIAAPTPKPKRASAKSRPTNDLRRKRTTAVGIGIAVGSIAITAATIASLRSVTDDRGSV